MFPDSSPCVRWMYVSCSMIRSAVRRIASPFMLPGSCGPVVLKKNECGNNSGLLLVGWPAYPLSCSQFINSDRCKDGNYSTDFLAMHVKVHPRRRFSRALQRVFLVFRMVRGSHDSAGKLKKHRGRRCATHSEKLRLSTIRFGFRVACSGIIAKVRVLLEKVAVRCRD